MSSRKSKQPVNWQLIEPPQIPGSLKESGAAPGLQDRSLHPPLLRFLAGL